MFHKDQDRETPCGKHRQKRWPCMILYRSPAPEFHSKVPFHETHERKKGLGKLRERLGKKKKEEESQISKILSTCPFLAESFWKLRDSLIVYELKEVMTWNFTI